MTRIEFGQLVAECSRLARSSPRSYRVRLFLLALLGHAYSALILAVTGLALALFIRLIGGSGALATALQFVAAPAVAVWLLLSTLRVRRPDTVGVDLDPSVEPRLFAEIEKIRTSVGAPRIHRVVLNNSLKVSVVRYPSHGPFGQYNVLTVGLALMGLLTEDEFRSVVAHELGLLAAGNGRFKVWICGLRARWTRVLDALTAEAPATAFLYRRFFQWYAPRFEAWSIVLTREHVLDADRTVLGVSGGEALADALARIAVAERLLVTRFNPTMQRLPAKNEDPPENYPKLLRHAAIHALESPAAVGWLRQALAHTTHPLDSRPALAERIRAMGVDVAHPGDWCRRLASSKVRLRPEAWLESGPAHAEELARGWREAVSPAWSEQRAALARLRAELNAIEARISAGERDVDDAVRWVELIAALQGPADAVDPARLLVKAHPEQAQAQFCVGAVLAELDDADAVGHLEQAMSLDPMLAAAALPIAWALLRRTGRDVDADAVEERWRTEVSKSVGTAWTTPLLQADRARLETARARADVDARAQGVMRFRRLSMRAVAILGLVLAGAAGLLTFAVWVFFTPRPIPYLVCQFAAVIAAGVLAEFLVLRRRYRGDIDLLPGSIRVTGHEEARSMNWSAIRSWQVRGRTLTLLAASDRLRLTVRRRDMARLCNAVARRVLTLRRQTPEPSAQDPGSGWTPDARRTRARVYTFRKRLRGLLPVLLLQLAVIVGGAAGSIEVFVIGMIALGILAWRISRTPVAVSVGLRWIRVHFPGRTESILLAAVADADIAFVDDDFRVIVQNRFGEPRPVPSVDGNVMGLYEAIRTNLEIGERSMTTPTAPRPGRRLLRRALGPAVAVAFGLLFYLPVRSGLLLYEAARARNAAATKALLAIGAPADGGFAGLPSLPPVVLSGDRELAARLIDEGADIDAPGSDGETPLLIATHRGDTAMIGLLLRRGASIDARSEADGRTALAAAAAERKLDIVRLLLERGADPNIPDFDGDGPVHHLVWSGGDAATMRMLLTYGADPDAIGAAEAGALHLAVMTRRLDLARELLDWGANPNADAAGSSPLQVANTVGDDGLVLELTRRGAK